MRPVVLAVAVFNNKGTLKLKPVDMIEIHDPENGTYGDCFRACIASLLERDPKDVPHFCGYDDSKEITGKWNIDVNKWLAQYGFAYVEWPVSSQEDYEPFFKQREENHPNYPLYHVITGNSPNFENTSHAVVGKNGKVFHDPSTTRKGVLNHEMYGFIIKL